jgi:hypothetical protein
MVNVLIFILKRDRFMPENPLKSRPLTDDEIRQLIEQAEKAADQRKLVEGLGREGRRTPAPLYSHSKAKRYKTTFALLLR